MITVFNTPDDPPIPRGSERFVWWAMMPRSSGGGNGYAAVRTPLPASANWLPGTASGSAGSYGMTWAAGRGFYRFHQGQLNAAPAFVTLGDGTAAMWLPSDMALTFQAAPPFAEVFIFREIIQSYASAPLPAGHQMLHGFTLVGNLLAGMPPLGAGSWRGIAICERTADVVLAVKNANPATVIPLPGVSLSAAPIRVEHRLYAPTPARIGRYELWLNESLAATVNGDHPNFPSGTVLTEGWRPMPFLLNNPGGAITAGFRCWWGEIIQGPDSAGTY